MYCIEFKFCNSFRNDLSESPIGVYCGNRTIGEITSSNKLILTFVSDSSNTGKGFRLFWYGSPGG